MEMFLCNYHDWNTMYVSE